MLEEFQKIGKFLFQERLVDSHGGNMSMRKENRIFITRSGAMLGDLKEGDIVEFAVEPVENEAAHGGLGIHRPIYK